jgi:hypothetical protein
MATSHYLSPSELGSGQMAMRPLPAGMKSVVSASDRDTYSCGAACSTLSLSIVVLGASGDLATKKTFPAIFQLHRSGFLPRKLQARARPPLRRRRCRRGRWRTPLLCRSALVPKPYRKPALRNPRGAAAGAGLRALGAG